MADDLKQLREQIDRIDGDIARLLKERADTAIAIGKNKEHSEMTSYADFARQEKVFTRIENLGGRISATGMRSIYRQIMSACLACEQVQKVAYLGPAGTFSHTAALSFFGHAVDLCPTKTILSAVRETEKGGGQNGGCHFAILPFENSSEGTVGETMDALLETPLNLCGELMLRVRHNLLSKSALANIKTVYAHSQALAQCRRWLDENAANAERVACASNTNATQRAQTEENAAAIGSRLAAQLYDIPLAATDIEDSASNTTRFLVLGHTPCNASGDDKTSFIMSTKDEPGAMLRLLQPLDKSGVNMTKLESRPSRGNLWEYVFFIDIVGHQKDTAVAQALAEVKARAAFMKIMGSYPKAKE